MEETIKERVVKIVDEGLRVLFTPAAAKRETPAAAHEEVPLSPHQRQTVARLMRVNHCGEVCAQALYQGQALFARDAAVRERLQEAADEEIDHLAWTAQRVEETGGRLSVLNPLWYGGAFAIGAAAALVSDKISLGFVAETENQVSRHLQSHLERLPLEDEKSRAIVQQMDIDEQEHAAQAQEMGGAELPAPVKCVMQLMGKVMTRSSYWV